MEISETFNADFIDSQFRRWKSDPKSVSKDWRYFFKGFEIGALDGAQTTASAEEGVCQEDQMLLQTRVQALIIRHRTIGHLLSCLDPLEACPADHPLLQYSAFQLNPEDFEKNFYCDGLLPTPMASLRDIFKALRRTYCRSIGVEFMHIQDPQERGWLMNRMESVQNHPELNRILKVRMLEKLFQATIFEQFLNKKYPGQTRFSLEGAEGLIPMLDILFFHAAKRGCEEIILGMAHRGRLNVQTNVLRKPYENIFREFESSYAPESLVGEGDVKYHQGYLTEIQIDDKVLKAFLVNNPSHLESVNPVVEGLSKARQNIIGDTDAKRLLPLLIHGDAAFAGQGVVAETLNFSQLNGYRTGGTVHVVINNQIGYTTLPEDARSTRYSTDIAKMLMIPIFHVHGENPEALAHLAQLAVDYRQEFGKDVVIDMVCFRRHGHNEGDEPYFTQPKMYERIRQRPTLPEIYAQKLIEEDIVNQEDVDKIKLDMNLCIEEAYTTAREKGRGIPFPKFFDNCKEYHGNFSFEKIATSVNKKTLLNLSKKLNTLPKDFSVFNKLERLLKKRQECVVNGEGIDWANAEALAFGSLLIEGHPIRLSGQDSGRGTFSQRHAVVSDTTTGDRYVPLNHLSEDQARFEVYDSSLSEVGIMGFEYGYSLAQPKGLVMWEAQFGDFANNAQAVIDLYIASGEAKWQRFSGLTLLLPHGYEGLGPEHSSARLERFLQLCACNNIQVCYPSLPSQYFHMLRRQALASYRKPLIVMTPKSLLRNPMAVSSIKDFSQKTFQPVLDDPSPPKKVSRVNICSGKIFYELDLRRREIGDDTLAIVRIEQLYPFPEKQLKSIFKTYGKAKTWNWVQEEPENMGAWNFVRNRLQMVIGKPIEYIGRKESGSPSTGFPNLYKLAQGAISDNAVGPIPKKPVS
jgi:2-oxoglutarate dehydrogenase E1 component